LKVGKQRLEAFSDAVIAIIITIMVIYLPDLERVDRRSILEVGQAVLVLFVSFFIVGSNWISHLRLMSSVEEVDFRTIWLNLFFLFFLSLLPFFTRALIQHPDEILAAAGYDLVFLLVKFSSWILTVRLVRGMRSETKETERRLGRGALLRFIIAMALFALIATAAILYPRVSIIFFIGLPIASSILGLLFDHQGGGYPGGGRPPRPR
jgi:uncharacterized membrane protein